ncbi:hypothetical protein MNEG_6862 [Monoraphidium neglectum]|uniref:Uncharacterized protein n=1 Tax=Monoraphidium neglectum TaxID=145388 RepID=A0A0D2L166_9CHLO|nr:hypothetical protein MNEG_6862 [Monoraphidium neglectum]KIZ01099.1 hypothetical protein MNEG_6862 [Monoraphidium neglectum]|eukprot:XP_013900118.1 hypothetical protein MNEG_6862 [Monoraphidium neglectum]
MIQPRSRNWMAYLQTGFNYAHGLSAGGAATVSDKGRLRYPDGRRNYCGDAHNEDRWDKPTSPVVTYTTGQVINVDVVVAVNHMGRMSMQVCPLDAKPKQGKCKNLYLKGHGVKKGVKSWYLPGIDKWTGGNYGGDAPRYGDGTFSAYRMPAIPDTAGWGCTSQRLCNAFKDMWVYRTKWALPKDFKCSHCKLQWVWTTGHSCWPPCEKGNPFPQCTNKQVYPTCGTKGAAYPEEFYNCADVTITDNARIDPATNYPPWNWKVDIQHGTWGEVRPSIMHKD